MRTSLLAILTVVSLSAAGCVTLGANDDDPATPAASPFATLRTLLADLPCEVDSLGTGTSANFRPLALLPFDGSTHGEVDFHGDYMLVARYQNGGFEVVDIRDPQDPRHVAAFEDMKGGLDVKWSPDGQTALVGNTSGITLVDVRDPLNPVKEGFWKFPGTGLSQNAHMLYTRTINGNDWVFLAPNSNTGVWILKLVGEPGARSLELVTKVGEPAGGGPLGPHDMWVGLDALTNKTFLYIANGFEGWLAYDVEDPAAPKFLGGSLNLDANQEYTHTIMAAKVGNRRLVATVGEVGANAVKVYDATNLLAPVLVASWMADMTRPTLPNHNLQIVGDLLYVAHYGKGVYVFNLTKVPAIPYAGMYQMKPMARYAEGVTDAAPTNPLPFTHFWDVVVKDGIVYMNDVNAGLHVAGFGCLTPGEAAHTSTG